MKLYFNTTYNTELTLESDNIHNLLTEACDIRKLLNEDSYIGFNNYLNHHCEDCKGSVRIQSNILVYIMEEDTNEGRYYFKCRETDEGVSLSKITKDSMMFDRITKKIKG